MVHLAVASINLAALVNNVAQIKRLAPNSKILAMVKANAYGHGAATVALALQGQVDALGVMFLREAIELRKIGVKMPIVVLGGFFELAELRLMVQYDLATAVHNFTEINLLVHNKLEQSLEVWLKVDSGLHRLGIQPSLVGIATKRLLASGNIQQPLRFTTHFADADDRTKGKTLEQFHIFMQTIAGLAGETCVANSAALLNYPELSSAWIRPGILLYGIVPCPYAALALQPVMTLRASIIKVHWLKQGDTVGYGSAWCCPEAMPVGTVALGYGDGYPRSATGAPVLVNDKLCSVIGHVAMDMLHIDLRKAPQAKVGDWVELWGTGLPITEIARYANTIPYELFCRVNPARVHFSVLY